ncbi:MAG: Cd(II)/Pb(II)-responsive transcriptional regulator, partial [Burkholderiales bacterium]|nr:Cd(II)/Pb(II)-responsive transcriptional regulator [Burkholderiales bacterium]
MKIGELATATGTPVDTIRYYEKEGLISAPGRTSSNYRAYTPGHAERLNFIRHCRALDMSLDEVRTLLRFRDAPSENCGGVNALLDLHVTHVERRIAELTALHAQLRRLRAQCRKVEAAGTCGILWTLANAQADAAGRRSAHVGGAHARA